MEGLTVFMGDVDPTKWKLYESSMIKSIRRGLVDDAIHWASRLVVLGKDSVVWRRIFIHISEDIGLANESLPAVIEALYRNYRRLSSKGDTSFESNDAPKLPIVHAVMALAHSRKSREVDHALVVHFFTDQTREIPDYAVDFHSPKGRRMGRGVEHFFQEAGKIENEEVIFPSETYSKRSLAHLLKVEKNAMGEHGGAEDGTN